MDLICLCMGIVNLIVVCGNILVLYLLITQDSLHSSTNFLVLSLTISDLLMGMAILPFAIIQEERSAWLFGDLGCRLWLSLDVWLSTASIYNLLAISFDRYMAVRQPIKYPSISSTRVIRLMIGGVWLLSLLLAICLFVLETLDGSPKETCSPMELPSLYILFSATASFILPAVIMIVLNVSIFHTVVVKNRSKCMNVVNGVSMRIHRGRQSTEKEPKKIPMSCAPSPKLPSSEAHSHAHHCESSSLIPPESPPAKESEEEKGAHTIKSFFSHVMVVSMISGGGAQGGNRKPQFISSLAGDRFRFSRISMRTEIRVARTTGIVVAAFVICWFPFTLIYTLQAYDLCRLGDCVPTLFFTIAFWLGYSNSAINPILYAAFSRDFRSAFRKMILRSKK